MSRVIDAAWLVVAFVVGGKGHVSFDAGRCAQNMLLAAWDEGVGGSSNGLADRDAANAVHGAPDAGPGCSAPDVSR